MDVILKRQIRCASKEKGQAKPWIHESEFWGSIRAGDLRTAAYMWHVKPWHWVRSAGQELLRGREKTRSVWCPDSQGRSCKEEGAINSVKCCRGLGHTMTEDCPWVGFAKLRLWVIPRVASVEG